MYFNAVTPLRVRRAGALDDCGASESPPGEEDAMPAEFFSGGVDARAFLDGAWAFPLPPPNISARLKSMLMICFDSRWFCGAHLRWRFSPVEAEAADFAVVLAPAFRGDVSGAFWLA
jgi:hypothetical protein